MEAIIFVETAGTGSSREAIRSIEKLGFFTVLITERTSFLKQRQQFSDVHEFIYMNPITEERIRKEIDRLCQQGKSIKSIISFIDPFVSLAARLSNQLCNTKISSAGLQIMEDKILTREVLKNSSLTPQFRVFHHDESLDSFVKSIDLYFPLIVKSPLSKASKDVYLVEHKRELNRVMKKLLKHFPTQNILVEEYVDGPQFLVEVVVHEGNPHFIAFFKQDITKKSRFIVTGYQLLVFNEEITPFLQSLRAEIVAIIEELKIINAACHLELRYVEEGWRLIEINPRISGGAMNRIIEEAYGINLVRETFQLYIGKTPDIRRIRERHIYTYYITVDSQGKLLRIKGEHEASSYQGVLEVYIRPKTGSKLAPPLSMGNRYGYVMATGNSFEEAKNNAMNAARKVKFYLEPI